jgi:nitronate monooxygenase
MWPDCRLTDLFGIEHPLVLSPMAGFGTVELAAAVCDGGALGSIGCGPMSPEVAAKTIQDLRALTKKPINVNFFCHVPAEIETAREQAWRHRLLPYFRELGVDPESSLFRTNLPPFGSDMCAVVEDAKPEVVSFHFGLPDQPLLTRAKAAGCRVMSSATTVEEARWLEARGVDVVIAQGCEAGGHRATFLSSDLNTAMNSQPGTMALLPQIVDAVSVPVIAAGGISDGRGIAAAFALGASGTQMGTAYLLCPEAATTPSHRDALRRASADTSVLTNVFTGRPARALANRLIREIGSIADAAPPFPLPIGASTSLRALAEKCGSTDFTPFWAGQASALARESPAKALTANLVREAIQRFERLATKAGRRSLLTTEASGL